MAVIVISSYRCGHQILDVGFSKRQVDIDLDCLEALNLAPISCRRPGRSFACFTIRLPLFWSGLSGAAAAGAFRRSNSSMAVASHQIFASLAISVFMRLSRVVFVFSGL
jgi:hypothetical protein